MARALGPCEVLGVTWAAGPRGHRRSADTKEIGFPGPFFTTPPRNSAEAAGMAARARCQENRAAASNRTIAPGVPGYLTRSGGGCPGPPGGSWRRARQGAAARGRRLPAAGQPGLAGGQRLACHRAWPARVAWRGPACLSPGRPRSSRGRPGQPGTCPPLRSTVPAYLAGALAGSPPARAGAPGEGRSSARGGSRPGSGQDAALPLVTVASRYRGQPSRFPQPAFRQAARRG